ncbi:MAG TPA: GNAT family N-acetyltransferase [Candidatus Kryptonia bacterium]
MNQEKDDHEKLNIRIANEADSGIVLGFIKDLAEFEKLAKEVRATDEIIRENVFRKKYAEVLIAEYKDLPVGFALYFHNFSTFLGRPGIYLEDLYIRSEFRGKGFGKQLLIYLAKLARQRECGRVEWAVLDWNEKAISFYKSLGAIQLNDWIVNRVTGSALENLADEPCASWIGE